MFLATVQIGITLVGVLAGAFGGATLAEALAAWLERWPALAPYSEALAVGTVVVFITYFSLVLGELVPKRLALTDPERFAPAVAGPMRRLARLARPLVRFLDASTNGVLRLLRLKPPEESPVTSEEIKLLLAQGQQAGLFAPAEQAMVASVFRLGERRLGSLATPRTDIAWLDLDDPPEVLRSLISACKHDRLPAAHGNLDAVKGIVPVRRLLSRLLDGEALDVMAVMEEAVFLPENMPALKALELFQQQGVHMVMVLDEYGGLHGLVTLYDLLTSITGDFPQETAGRQASAVQREDGSWLVDGLLPVDEFKDLLGLATLPQDGRGLYQTVAGLVITQLGRIPSAADHFDWENWRFEVVDMDGLRVDKVLVSPLEQILDYPTI